MTRPSRHRLGEGSRELVSTVGLNFFAFVVSIALRKITRRHSIKLASESELSVPLWAEPEPIVKFWQRAKVTHLVVNACTGPGLRWIYRRPPTGLTAPHFQTLFSIFSLLSTSSQSKMSDRFYFCVSPKLEFRLNDLSITKRMMRKLNHPSRIFQQKNKSYFPDNSTKALLFYFYWNSDLPEYE